MNTVRAYSYLKAGWCCAGLFVVTSLLLNLSGCGIFGTYADARLHYPHTSHSTDALLDKRSLRDVVQPPVIPGAQWMSPRDGALRDIGSYARAGITSHHLLAAWYIDRFFADLAEQRRAAHIPIKTFIVLSPRHFEQGQELAAFSDLPWDTGLGTVTVNRKLADRLRRSTRSKWEPYSFMGEHGIGVPASFIKKHFPDASMVPIVLEIAGLKMEVLERLASAIAQVMQKDDRVFLLVSSDFSHGEGLELTRQRDAQSELALRMLDSNSARRVCCDNNAGMVILGSVLEKLARGKGFTAAHTSGYEIIGIKENITSYFFCYF